jgi:hypothetical protein
MKSYLNRAISLAVSYWLVMAVVTANLSIILTYIFTSKAAWAAGSCSVVHRYRLRWSNYTAEACLTVE